MIRLQNIVRRFHDLVAVDDLSLHVAEGEILGFVGPNGAGKTTTLRILTGFLPATSGRATLAGHDVASESLAVRRKLGYLPESVPLPTDARVEEYLEFRARLKGLSAEQRRSEKERCLSVCGLLPMRRRIIGQLSRGYRQRTGLADALLGDPPVLILDEATGGLDPGQREEILELVAALRGRRTVIISSHVLAEIEHVASRVAIIRQGRLAAVGTREELEADAGRRGEYEIFAPGARDRLRAALTARGLVPRDDATGKACIVRLAHERDAVALLAALVAEGLPIAGFHALTRTLHEIFLDLVREPTP